MKYFSDCHHLVCVDALLQHGSFLGENFNTVLTVRIIFLVKNNIRSPAKKTFPPHFAIVHPAVNSATKYFLISSHTNLMIINSIPGKKKIVFLKKYIRGKSGIRLILKICINRPTFYLFWELRSVLRSALVWGEYFGPKVLIVNCVHIPFRHKLMWQRPFNPSKWATLFPCRSLETVRLWK